MIYITFHSRDAVQVDNLRSAISSHEEWEVVASGKGGTNAVTIAFEEGADVSELQEILDHAGDVNRECRGWAGQLRGATHGKA